MNSQEKHSDLSIGHGSDTPILDAKKVPKKALRQPKAGDIWVCQEGAVLVFSISDIGVEYLWQDTPDEFIVDSRSAKDWHKNFDYKENIFDCEDLKDDDPKLYKEIKEQQQMFERLTKKDPINHPKHYTSDPSGIECIEITRHRNFNIGNAIKYLWRAGLKDGNSDIQDLKKAIWYIQDEIKRLEAKNSGDQTISVLKKHKFTTNDRAEFILAGERAKKSIDRLICLTSPQFHWAYSNDDNHDK